MAHYGRTTYVAVHADDLFAFLSRAGTVEGEASGGSLCFRVDSCARRIEWRDEVAQHAALGVTEEALGAGLTIEIRTDGDDDESVWKELDRALERLRRSIEDRASALR
jgi:hypothetical protein